MTHRDILITIYRQVSLTFSVRIYEGSDSVTSRSLYHCHTPSLKMLIQSCHLLLLAHFVVGTPICDLDTTYEWPLSAPKWCCKKCEPGQYMSKRCTENAETKCETCGDGYYMNEYNYEMACKLCSKCTKENMEYKQNCTKGRDAVCGCKTGYKCSDAQCMYCVQNTTPTPTTTTTAVTTNTKPKEPDFQVTDSVWISLSLCCACVCILLTCFILISRHTPARGWTVLASAACCFWTSKKSSAQSSQCTEEEEEEVPMPVQEVCGGKADCVKVV